MDETPVDETPVDDIPPEDDSKKKTILIVGAVAVVVIVILLIAFMPREPQVDPYVVQLEGEVAAYTGQIDSLNMVVDGLNGRFDAIRAQMDSAQASNRILLASLQRVTNEVKEYRRLYSKQKALNQKLVAELQQARSEKDEAIGQIKSLKTEVDGLNDQLYTKTIRLVRLESSLEEAMEEKKQWKEAATTVLVYAGTEDELKQDGYLKAWRPAIFSKDYKTIGFPDVMDEKNKNVVLRIPLGETYAIPGELQAVADRHGKLDKGKEYEISEGPPGQTLITFVDPTLQGQRILAVLKKQK